MIVFERAVKFEEVDAAGIVFFARFATYAHEAMENFFSQLEGGYVRLITERRLGLPAVKFASEFLSPLRYGDVVSIETTVEKLGRRSAVFLYEVKRKSDDVVAARMRHMVVFSDLDKMKSCDMPEDVRAAFEAHI
jgi:4-hydroxybenzoyl-CoA thioesterase